MFGNINIKIFNWPDFNKDLIKEEQINLVIQINGKKKSLIKIEPDKTENEILKIHENDEN